MEETQKFEYRSPDVPYGPVLVGCSFTGGFGFDLPLGSAKVERKFTPNKNEASASLELQITKWLSAKGGPKLSEKAKQAWPKLIEAVGKRQPKAFLAALGDCAKIEIKLPGMAAALPVDASFDIAGILKTPVSVKGKVLDWKYPLSTDVNLVVKGEMGVFLGLSPKGWADVGVRFSRQAMQSFFAEAGATLQGSLSTFVAAGGLEIAGATIGLLAWVGGGLYAIGKAHETGRIRGLVTWCGSGYVNKVWGKDRPSGYVLPESQKLRDALIDYGERMAVEHARQIVPEIRKGDARVAGFSEQAVLYFYKEYLESYFGGQGKAQAACRENIEKATYDALTR